MKNPKNKKERKSSNIFYYFVIVLIVIVLYRRLFNKGVDTIPPTITNPFRALTQDTTTNPVEGGIYWAVNEYFSTNPNGTKFQSSGEYAEYGPIAYWNTSNITDMSELFKNKSTFNDNISGWNVSNVTNMFMMFFRAPNFNQPIGSWDVSNVTNMELMFDGAKSFNKDISTKEVTVNGKTYTAWDVSNVTDMNSMFYGATAFNKNLSAWSTNGGGFNAGLPATIQNMFDFATAMRAKGIPASPNKNNWDTYNWTG